MYLCVRAAKWDTLRSKNQPFETCRERNTNRLRKFHQYKAPEISRTASPITTPNAPRHHSWLIPQSQPGHDGMIVSEIKDDIILQKLIRTCLDWTVTSSVSCQNVLLLRSSSQNKAFILGEVSKAVIATFLV